MDKVTNDAVFLKSAKHKFLECFERFVKPYNVIDLFHKYNPNVLTEEDKCRVRAKSQNEGDISAAKFLFETLLSYADWYPCTIQVFRDPQVKLSHVADEMESIKVDFMNCFKRQEVELGEMCTHIFKLNMNDPHCLCKIKEARLKVNCELLQNQVTEEKENVSKMNVQYNTLLNDHKLTKQQIIEEKERGFNNRGNHKAPMLVSEGIADPHKNVTGCKKNPGHKGFIPLKDFNIKCLPSRYRKDELMFNTIKTLAALTVQVKTEFTSLERPEFYPGTQVPYPFYNDRGSHVMRIGTGRVWSVDKYTESDGTCRCGKCQTSDTPSKVWGKIFLDTATVIVFDDSEARQTRCVLGFDDNKSPVVSLDGWEVVGEANIEGDMCQLSYVTCDLELADELDKMCRRFDTLCEEVRDKYKRIFGVDKLTFIVSHPHGCPKQVSVGQWTHKRVRDDRYTRYWYTTDACPGSSGAYVYRLGCNPLHSRHVHSGANSEGNYCGESVG